MCPSVDFTIEQRLTGTVDEVQAALLDPSYVTARAALPRLGEPELVELTQDGTAARQRVRLRFTAELSSAVTAVVDPAKLTWVDDATWSLGDHRAEHVIVPDHYGDRLKATYTESLVPDGDGTRRTLRGTLRVKVLLVGGKVESAIVSGLREYAVAETELLDHLVG
jgi:hypothetical protein